MAIIAASRSSLGAIPVAAIAACYTTAQWISALEQTFKPSLEAVAIAVIIWSLVNAPRSAIGRVLESRPVVFVGVISYSLYLWQQLFLNPHPTHQIPTWWVGVMLSFATAVASYYVIERPFLSLKGRVAPKKAQQSAKSVKPARSAAVVTL